MKKLYSILCLAFLWAASSCDDKAEMNYVKKNDLVGKWDIIETGVMNSQGGLDYYPYQNSSCGTDVDNFEFNEDLTFSQNDYSDSTGSCQKGSLPGTYIQENHSLTLTQVIEGVTKVTNVTITTLDATHLQGTFDQGGQLFFIKLERE